MRFYLIITLIIPLLSVAMEPPHVLTPLEKRFLAAAKDDDLISIKECLAQQVNINVSEDYNGETALFRACMWGCYETVELLLQQKDIEVNTTGKVSFAGYAPLHLIFNGISDEKFTPTQKGQLLRLLLQKNANINASTAKGPLGNTVLSLAIEFCKADTHFLVEHLIDANIAFESTGWSLRSPLTKVIYAKKPPLIVILLKSRRVTKNNVITALEACAGEYLSNLHKVLQNGNKICTQR